MEKFLPLLDNPLPTSAPHGTKVGGNSCIVPPLL